MKNLSKAYFIIIRGCIYVIIFLPLLIWGNFLFPFQFFKVIVFRILVEIMLVIFILLILSDARWRPRWNFLATALSIFVGLYFLSSLAGINFYKSFWGSLERMGGFYTFLHYFIFFIISVSIFKKKEDWLNLLKLSIIAGFFSALYAFGQKIGLDVLESGRLRVVGTIGNPALFAGYMIFNSFFALLFFLQVNISKKSRIFWGLAFLMCALALFLTAVRGSILGFIFGLIVFFSLYSLLFKKGFLRKTVIVAGLIVIIASLGIWFSQDTCFIQGNPYLRRLTDISLKTETLQTRFWAWQAAWHEWQKRFWLGWGPENFDILYAKHFNPLFFKGPGTEVLWDRPHNVFLEIGVTMGVFALLAYFSLFVIVFYFCFKRYREVSRFESLEHLLLIGLPTILGIYLIHSFFIFDVFSTFLSFFLVLGCIQFFFISQKEKIVISKKFHKKSNSFLIIFLISIATLVIYCSNLKPLLANRTAAKAKAATQVDQLDTSLNLYQKVLDYNTFVNFEARKELAESIINIALNKNQQPENLKQAFDLSAREIKKNIDENPLDPVSYLYLGRLYNVSKINLASPVISLDEIQVYLKKAIRLSPTRQQIYYELGHAMLFEKDYQQAISFYQKALGLNPKVAISSWYLGVAYAEEGDLETGISLIEKAIEMDFLYYKNFDTIMKLVEIYNKAEKYKRVEEFYQGALSYIRKHPDQFSPSQKAQVYASLAATYKVLGNGEKAIFYAQKAAETDPKGFSQEASEFIKSLK